MPTIYVPFVAKEGEEVSGQSDEDALFELVANSPNQQRTIMIRHPLLDLAAYKKAQDMVDRNYWGHIAPDGKASNDVIRSVGYMLPEQYKAGKNNCESLSKGAGVPKEVAEGWWTSDKHKIHVYGLDKFYREQQCIGLGRAKNSAGTVFSVFLSAPCF